MKREFITTKKLGLVEIQKCCQAFNEFCERNSKNTSFLNADVFKEVFALIVEKLRKY